MAYSAVFRRYEMKYLISVSQRERIMKEIEDFVTGDKYGCSTVRNIYFDTPDYRLIRRSVEKPPYKEKFRIRCYEKADKSTTVFAELKKKYKKVVYKRRAALTEEQAVRWLFEDGAPPEETQITREIDYFRSFYKPLEPKVFLSYKREAYYGKDDPDFRITFDTDIRFRTERLSLEEEAGGIPLLSEDTVLMEIKCTGALPLRIARILSAEKIYKTSFSKYGTAYLSYILPKKLTEAKND